MDTKQEIERKLSVLVGLPFWNGGRVHNLLMLEFGQRREVAGISGPRAVRDYALHIECPWRIVGPLGIAVGSDDRGYPPDGFKGSREQWDRENSESLWDSRLRALMTTFTDNIVDAVQADTVGGIRLVLRNLHAIEVFPCSSREIEHWRLVRR